MEAVDRLLRHPGTAKLKRFIPINVGPTGGPERVHPTVRSVAPVPPTERQYRPQESVGDRGGAQ